MLTEKPQAEDVAESREMDTIEGAFERQCHVSPVRVGSPVRIRTNRSSPSLVDMQTPVMRNTNIEYIDTFVVSPDDVDDEDDDPLGLPQATTSSQVSRLHHRPSLQQRSSHHKIPHNTVVNTNLNQPLPLKKFLSYGHQPSGLELPPYQPSGREQEDFEEDDLQRIFNPIPLVSQFSIPSIRMGNELEDDEESWTSRGSSLYLPEDGDLMTFIQPSHPITSPPIIVEAPPLEVTSSFQPRDTTSVDAICRTSSNPYAWLRTVNAEEDEIAEAASSKFLTNGFIRRGASLQEETTHGSE